MLKKKSNMLAEMKTHKENHYKHLLPDNYYLNQNQMDEYVQQLLPLIKSWLPDDNIVKQDKEKVKTVDRNFICSN